MTYQLLDVGHLSHVVQSVFRGLVQHDEAGGHGDEVPDGLHVGLNVTVAVCRSEDSIAWCLLMPHSTSCRVNMLLC